MGRFAEDMGRLREEIAAGRVARQAGLAENRKVTASRREEVAGLRGEFAHAQGVMAKEVRAASQSFVAGIAGAVADIKRESGVLIDEFAQERRAGAQAWHQGAGGSAVAATPGIKGHLPPKGDKPVPKAKGKPAGQVAGQMKGAPKAAAKPSRV